MSNKKIIEYIKNSEFFKDLNDEYLAIIADTSQIINYSKNKVVFQEGDSSRDLYYIISGEIELYKTYHEKHISLGVIKENSFMGEMAFVDGSDRSAAAAAYKDSKIIKFNYSLLQEKYPELLNIITPKVCTIIMQRLRASNSSNVKNIEEKLQQLKLQYEFGYFFMAIIVGLGVSTFLEKLLSTFYVGINGYNQLIYNWIYLFAVSGPFVYLVYLFKYKITDFGVTTKNFYNALMESIVISIIGIFFLLVIVHYLNKDMSIWQNIRHSMGSDSILVTLKIITYLADSSIQEFVSRGIFQTSLRKFLSDKHGIKSILVTSTIYVLGHLYFTVSNVALTFLISIFLGILFHRHKNIIGISLIHFSIGGTAIALGLM